MNPAWKQAKPIEIRDGHALPAGCGQEASGSASHACARIAAQGSAGGVAGHRLNGLPDLYRASPASGTGRQGL